MSRNGAYRRSQVCGRVLSDSQEYYSPDIRGNMLVVILKKTGLIFATGSYIKYILLAYCRDDITDCIMKYVVLQENNVTLL